MFVRHGAVLAQGGCNDRAHAFRLYSDMFDEDESPHVHVAFRIGVFLCKKGAVG